MFDVTSAGISQIGRPLIICNRQTIFLAARPRTVRSAHEPARAACLTKGFSKWFAHDTPAEASLMKGKDVISICMLIYVHMSLYAFLQQNMFYLFVPQAVTLKNQKLSGKQIIQRS